MDTRGRDYVSIRMPIIGLGTYQIRSEKTIFSIVDEALSTGYRFIDTAQLYANEAAIGRALKELLPKYNLKREDIFITTKISPANQGRALAGKSIERSLEHLQTDYLDLLIIHWPGCNKMKVDDPRNADYRKDTYQVMEEYYKKGVLRAIGVSNYEVVHLKQLLAHATVAPALNQVEYHPHFHQTDLVEYCKSNGIHFQAYSSLGGADHRDRLFSDKTVVSSAEKHGLAVSVYLLAWAISQGISVLPRSQNPDRVRTNYSASTVTLDKEEVQAILNNGIKEKACWDPSTVL